MRNQTSFRLTTTLLPTDMTAKTTTVINKVDSDGNKFYPTFTEETIVLTNDDRTVMETTKATCTDGVLTFVKRGLSDDDSETQVANRKLTRNPGTLAFITAGAGDWIDKDDNITWSGNQTYSGNLTSQGTATYAGRLITQKGVEYPHFNNVEALENYNDPFGGMFAVVDSTGELYRYNAVTEEWSVVTTNTPTNPEMADDETIGTVRVATDAEFAASTTTGGSGEYLMATVGQIKANIPTMALNVTALNISETVASGDTDAIVSYTATRSGFLQYSWEEQIHRGEPINSMSVYTSGTTSDYVFSGDVFASRDASPPDASLHITHKGLIAVGPGTIQLRLKLKTTYLDGDPVDDIDRTSASKTIKLQNFFYFG